MPDCAHGRAGMTAVIDVAETTVKEETAVLFNVASDVLVPRVTAVAPVKFVPVIVTDVPPADEPVPAALEIVGAGYAYVYVVETVPPKVSMTTGWVPRFPAGTVTTTVPPGVPDK